MNKLSFGFLLFATILFHKGFCQLSEFDLSKYYLPELDRRALETRFNFWGTNNFFKAPTQSMYYTKLRDSKGVSANLNLIYSHYHNSAEYQKESNVGLDFLSNFLSEKTDNYYYKSSSITPFFFLQSDNRKYFNQKSFYETNFEMYYQYANSNEFIEWTNDSFDRKDNVQSHSFLAYVPLKFGAGRIEQVQDARHAVYLFEELSKIDRISSDKSNEQIIDFARHISKLKNKRFFDSRLRRMSEIESVDSFLVSKNYVSESDARYFTTLSDFWEFGNRPLRNNGTRIAAAIVPGYYYYDYNNPGNGFFLNSAEYSISAFLLDAGIEIKYEKPINLLWQNSIEIKGFAGIVEANINDKAFSTKDKLRIPNFNLGFNQTIGFYPNTRTDISFRYSIQYVQLFDKTDFQNEIYGVEGVGAKAETYLSLNYYISPKFRLRISSFFYYIWQDSEDEVIINFDNLAGSRLFFLKFNNLT